jgi:hypothetical protein
MSSSVRRIDEPGAEAGPAPAARGEALRDLLVKYQRALALTEKLAIALLDSVQPDAEPMTPEQARERRHTVAEAMTLVAAETSHGEQLWRDLDLERRLAHPASPLPMTIRTDRRRKPPRRATPRPKL